MLAKNVGQWDRIARFILGVVLIALALGLHDPASSGLWWGWIGVIPLATAIFGTCPLYSLIGLNTCRR